MDYVYVHKCLKLHSGVKVQVVSQDQLPQSLALRVYYIYMQNRFFTAPKRFIFALELLLSPIKE